jgi:hypothetical protein
VEVPEDLTCASAVARYNTASLLPVVRAVAADRARIMAGLVEKAEAFQVDTEMTGCPSEAGTVLTVALMPAAVPEARRNIEVEHAAPPENPDTYPGTLAHAARWRSVERAQITIARFAR